MDAEKAVYYVGLICLVLGINMGYWATVIVRAVIGDL